MHAKTSLNVKKSDNMVCDLFQIPNLYQIYRAFHSVFSKNLNKELVLKGWSDKLSALKPVLSEGASQKQWPALEQATQNLKEIQKKLQHDVDYLEKNAKFIFSVDEENSTRKTAEVFRGWYVKGDYPSLSAMAIFGMHYAGLKPDDEIVRMVLTASVLGEVENDLPYHSNMHYRKVVFHILRMCMVHNDIYEGTRRAFTAHQIALLIAAASIHDLGHDGKGNSLEGEHIRARLEQFSVDLAVPYFEALGFGGQDLQDIQIMLLCTDVTPINSPRNPVNQMKAAYRFHHLGNKEGVDSLNLSADLKPLEKRSDLVMMSLVLHEADLATSSGVNYTVTKFETGLVREEMGSDIARPSDIIQFLDGICGRQILSNAGQELYAANMARIYALAEEDYNKGNEPYPKVSRSDFILGENISDQASVGGSDSLH